MLFVAICFTATILLFYQNSALNAFFSFKGTLRQIHQESKNTSNLMDNVVDLDGIRLDRYLQHFAKFSQFDTFDNATGSSDYLVPNIVHYIRFNKTSFNFVEYCCIRSAFINHRPDYIFFHTNVKSFNGIYWEAMNAEPGLRRRIKIIPTALPDEIFSQAINEAWRMYHGSDIARIQILIKYGGIFLESDVYVVQNLDKYRKFEMVIAWDEDKFLCNQIIVANKNARFLHLWIGTYKVYRKDLWHYNSLERPTVKILFKSPELVHRVEVRLG